MVNPKAQAAKDKGNVAFKAGDYPLAIGHYTSAIMADSRDPTYPLNRAAAYLKLGKNEDAERDCNTVLNLSANNVKALFRRGQARVGTGKLLEAQKDFNEVVRIEPVNTAAQEELKKVATLIQDEKAKKAKAPVPPGIQASLDTFMTTKRRRVPIKIIDASGAVVNASSQDISPAASTSANTAPTKPQPAVAASSAPTPASAAPKAKPKSTPAPAPTPKTDTLEPVSSRSLKPSPAAPPVPPALAAAAAALQAELNGSSTGKEKGRAKAQETAIEKGPTVPTATPVPVTFQQAKQARESAKPSRTGGGIFRSSGQNTIFPSRGGEVVTRSGIEEVVDIEEEKANVKLSATEPVAAPVQKPSTVLPVSQPAVNIAPTTVSKAPTTYFDFNKAWHSYRSPEERWALLNTITPSQFPALCQTSLEPALLISILDVFLTLLTAHSGDVALSSKVLEYMQSLARIPRFSTLVLFLSRPEKEVAKGVWGLLGVEPAGAWKGVGY